MHGRRLQFVNMKNHKYLLDANAVLRFLLKDNEIQYQRVFNAIQKENCYVNLEVMAEVCYVLEGLYGVSRADIVENLRKLNNVMTIYNVDILMRGLEIFDKSPKLDFVDCLLYGYKLERGMDILTFDRKLQKRLEEIELMGSD